MSERDILKFQQDAQSIELSNKVLEAAKSLMPDAHHFSLAVALFGACMKAIEEKDGIVGSTTFAKLALESIKDAEDRSTH